MVVLWVPNSLTSVSNFSFSLNLLKTFPWWYATFMIPLFFALIISSYRLIISAVFSGSCIFSASLFKSSNSTTLSMIIESNNCFFIYYRCFAFLLSAKPFHIYKQKNNRYSTKYKIKMFIQANFFCMFRSKKITSSAVIFSFSHFSFKVLSINSWVSGNLPLTASKTPKALFSRFLSILTTRACSFVFHYSALCFKKHLNLFYTDSWYMTHDTKYGYKTLIGFLNF